ncbi:membrane protein [Candidatus Magnetoovum chiemensis]|nr:membrane protein [Candidatus Magnetoovum chiemensis]
MEDIINKDDNNKEKEAEVKNAILTEYSELVNLIHFLENRMHWSESIYLLFNVVILITALMKMNIFSTATKEIVTLHNIFPYMAVILLIIVGEILCVYWIIASMRTQMKLKLRYFQARYLERRMDIPGVTFFTDESKYFNPKFKYIESPDKVEKIEYPSTGMTRMDGFAGSAKPRHLSWILPSILFLFYILLLSYTAMKILL